MAPTRSAYALRTPGRTSSGHTLVVAVCIITVPGAWAALAHTSEEPPLL
jgi:hypothetical protein